MSFKTLRLNPTSLLRLDSGGGPFPTATSVPRQLGGMFSQYLTAFLLFSFFFFFFFFFTSLHEVMTHRLMCTCLLFLVDTHT
jgi:hypothetical protein